MASPAEPAATAAGATADWEARCPAGQVVVSGGFGGDTNRGEGLQVSMSQPRYENNGWRVQATYVRPPSGSATVEGYALVSCAEGRSIG